MAADLSFVISLTTRALATIESKGTPNLSFSIQASASRPMPQTGDFVELIIDDAPRSFVVLKRTIPLHDGAAPVRLLLDAPPDV
jgi:hypothetical protein